MFETCIPPHPALLKNFKEKCVLYSVLGSKIKTTEKQNFPRFLYHFPFFKYNIK